MQAAQVGARVRFAREDDAVDVLHRLIRQRGVDREQRIGARDVDLQYLVPAARDAHGLKAAFAVAEGDEAHGLLASLVKAAPFRAARP